MPQLAPAVIGSGFPRLAAQAFFADGLALQNSFIPFVGFGVKAHLGQAILDLDGLADLADLDEPATQYGPKACVTRVVRPQGGGRVRWIVEAVRPDGALSGRLDWLYLSPFNSSQAINSWMVATDEVDPIVVCYGNFPAAVPYYSFGHQVSLTPRIHVQPATRFATASDPPQRLETTDAAAEDFHKGIVLPSNDRVRQKHGLQRYELALYQNDPLATAGIEAAKFSEVDYPGYQRISVLPYEPYTDTADGLTVPFRTAVSTDLAPADPAFGALAAPAAPVVVQGWVLYFRPPDSLRALIFAASRFNPAVALPAVGSALSVPLSVQIRPR